MRIAPASLLVAGALALFLAACDSGETPQAAVGEDDELGVPDPAAWSYHGDDGPSHWGSLDPRYEACSAGKRQSPIDLADGAQTAPPRVGFSYEPQKVEVVNDGHTLDLDFPRGSAIAIRGTRYELAQMHYHAPSEHLVDGVPAPLEFHFVHEAKDGSVAVLGLLAKEGREDPAFAPLLEDVPEITNEEVAVPGRVDALDLLPPDPASASRWSYRGSLTTPPCTEGVLWNVYREPIELSAEQIAVYEDVFEDNDRPIQPRNGRTLVLGSP